MLTNAHRTQRRLRSWPSYCGRTPRRGPTYPGRGGLIAKMTKGRRRQTVPIIEPLRPTLSTEPLWPRPGSATNRRAQWWRHDCDPGCSRRSWIDSPETMINISRRQAGAVPPAAFVPDPADATKWDDLVTELGLTGLARQRQRHALTWMADAGRSAHSAAGRRTSGSGGQGWLPACRRAGHAERRTAFSAWSSS